MSVDILSTATQLYENSIFEKASNGWMTLNVTRPPTSSSPCLWNQLPSSLRQPHSSLCRWLNACSCSYTTSKSNSVNSPLSPSITPSLFHSRLETYLFHKSFPPQSHFRPQDWFRGLYDRTVSSKHLGFSSLLFFVWFLAADLAAFGACKYSTVRRIVLSLQIKRFNNPYVTSYHWSVVTLSLPCNKWPFPRYCHFFIVRDCLWSCEVRQFWDHIRFQIHT